MRRGVQYFDSTKLEALSVYFSQNLAHNHATVITEQLATCPQQPDYSQTSPEVRAPTLAYPPIFSPRAARPLIAPVNKVEDAHTLLHP